MRKGMRNTMRWNVVLLVMALSGILVGCETTNQPPSEQSIIAGMEKVNNYDGLIALYKSKLVGGIEDDNAVEQLAYVYFEKGDVESSRFYTQYLIGKGLKNKSLLQLKGQIEAENGHLEEAIDAYNQSISLGNTSGKIRVLLGVAYSKSDQFSKAKAQFNLARLRGYDDIVIKNNLAVVYLAEQRFDLVIETLAPVLKEHPTNQTVKANLAIALLKSGKSEQAKALLRDQYNAGELLTITQQFAYVEAE
ncbi:tetratricopeptide repeat protein [Vibrio sp. ZSDZ65]|uniref:Tetratricopeptide repeat protein n=1 Tax=Vibrio qingdaonensis TaxID=2829491 RepID=A0A9X3CJZ7_9VIBR|nr:tetratricopeptide repeat protein [Vibrio qingdaonensis]MCW8344686.1 tetratricopeptide repeat protein [Vibrio qingdaonensis]